MRIHGNRGPARLVWSGMLACLPLLAGGGSAGAAEPEIVEVQRVPGAPAAGHRTLSLFVAAAQDYWIGGHFVPLNDLVKSQLKLEHGLAAVHIVEDSPAATAGLKPHDILLTLDGKPLPDVPSLVKAVEQAEGKEVEAGILRGGSRETLKITPEERPVRLGIAWPKTECEEHSWIPQGLRSGPLGDMARWFDEDGTRMLLVKPGVVVPGGLLARLNFPQNLSVTIQREGDSPLKISVKRDQQSWEITENELDKLPEAIRGVVKSMLEGQSFQIRVQAALEEPGDKAVDPEAKSSEDPTANAKPGTEGRSGVIRRRILVSPKDPPADAIQRARPVPQQAEIRIERRRESKNDEVQELKDQVQQLRQDLELLRRQLQPEQD